MNQRKKIISAGLILTVFSLIGPFGSAGIAQSAPVDYKIYLDAKTIAKGYTVASPGERLKLSLVPGILSESTEVEIKELDEKFELPWELEKISPVMQFEFKNKKAHDNKKAFYIQFDYDKDADGYKQVFFYDKGANAWRSLPTWDYPDKKFVRSLIYLPYARIAVFSNPSLMAKGKASWYSYKKGMYAASPDFPAGSILRVHALGAKTDKYVDVEVNDFGPDRKAHPDRVVDLSKDAFQKIASLSEGTVKVYVEPLKVTGSLKQKLAEYEKGARTSPDLAFRSAIIMNEATGEILHEKNADSAYPLASLTKLIAVKVFLDVHPSVAETVAYSKADEEFNYQYCKPWESGKLSMDEGETLTINDLVYSSLVGSTNNTVETLVRVSGLSRLEFIAKMNETVKTYGAVNTNFEEPSGLSPKNVSSSRDYAIISREALKDPIISAAASAASYKFKTFKTDGKEKEHNIRNTNTLVREGKYFFTGSKTGYIDEAKYCLMSRVKAKNGDSLIIVTMGADTREESFRRTEDLIKLSLRSVESGVYDKLAAAY